MYPNPLKQKLRDGELVLGSVLPAFSPHIAGIVLGNDLDFLWLDTEHLPYGVEALDTLTVLARQRGVAPMIRIANGEPGRIKKALDVGAVAVMVPQVNTAEEAAAIVRAAKYPPLGERGITPAWTYVAGEDFNHVVKTGNEESVIVLQIESAQAYERLDAIAAVEGVDVLFVGPMDMSASVGVITETGHERVQRIMEDVPKRLAGSGIVAGTTLVNVDDIQEKIGWGYRFMNVGNIAAYGSAVLASHLTTLRANPEGS